MAEKRYKIVVERPDETLIEFATSHRLDFAERIAACLSRQIGVSQVGIEHNKKLKALYWKGRLQGRDYV